MDRKFSPIIVVQRRTIQTPVFISSFRKKKKKIYYTDLICGEKEIMNTSENEILFLLLLLLYVDTGMNAIFCEKENLSPP